MEIAQGTNQYLEERAPWSAVKNDPEHAGETLHTAINAISGITTLLQPFLPFTCAAAWDFLGHSGEVQEAGWRRTPVAGETLLPEPRPLFRKLDDSIVEEEEAALGT